MGKIIEKLVAKKFFHYCEKYSKLYFRQIKGNKNRLAIDIVITLVYIEKKWEEK